MQDFCLFARFDKDDKVDEHVLRYLKHIKELDFFIVFISTACLPPGEVKRLRSGGFDVIVRENVGLDFGSWAMGFAKHAAAINGRHPARRGRQFGNAEFARYVFGPFLELITEPLRDGRQQVGAGTGNAA